MMDVTSYAAQLLDNVADEVNVKQIRLRAGHYNYDTIKRRGLGFEGDYLPALTVLFSGDVLRDMVIVRELVAEGLRQRSKAGIKVRQPLGSLTVAV